MSTLKVEAVKIDRILPHPNADHLELAQIKGWQCVVGKGSYKEGDLAVYFPIDSVLPNEVEAKIFGPDSKVKLSKGRIKTIKLRGAISQGLLVRFDTLGLPVAGEGSDLTNTLGVKKYEQPLTGSGMGKMVAKSPKLQHPHFDKYTSIENLKNYNKLFEEGEEVIITEKIHGTNFRAGYVPKSPRNFFQKILSKLGLLKGFEFVYGSHNVWLDNDLLEGRENVYAEAVKNYGLEEKLKSKVDSLVVYGEIYGSSIQKNYLYGCKQNERKLVVFDIKVNGKYLPFDSMERTAKIMRLPTVPVLYRGPFSMDVARSHVDGDSVMCPEQKVREGIVIKPVKEENSYIGRKILKFISDKFLLKDNTEFH